MDRPINFLKQTAHTEHYNIEYLIKLFTSYLTVVLSYSTYWNLSNS